MGVEGSKEGDRGIVAVKNLLERYRIDAGASSIQPEDLPITTGRDGEFKGGRAGYGL